MRSHTTAGFRAALARLPESVRQQARAAYRVFREDPNYPGLHFEQIQSTESVWSARIGVHYRAVGVRTGEDILWYWIGSHADYDKLITRRRKR